MSIENIQKIQIYEGESQISANNRYLGQMILSELEPGPAGDVKATLTLELDASGVLHATALHQKRTRGGVVYESKVRELKFKYVNSWNDAISIFDQSEIEKHFG